MRRVGIVSVLHESNTFIEAATTLEDFRQNLLVMGPALIESFTGHDHEVGGFIDVCRESKEVEAVGVFAARAMPYGVIEAPAWRQIKELLRESVRAAGPIDGWLVAPHGATVAEQARDADGDWLSLLRTLVGPAVPILGTLDLHANVSSRMVHACQGLAAYRTNPHLDQRARGQQVAEWMVKTLRGEYRPTAALVPLPLCVNIERQATSEPHARWLFELADQLVAAQPNLLSISPLWGFPYADVPEMGAAVVATTTHDTRLAHQAASHLASAWWERRAEFVGELLSCDDVLQQMQSAPSRERNPSNRPWGLLDMGDNVGGGSSGASTYLLHELLKRRVSSVFACLYDPAVVELVYSHGDSTNTWLDLDVGRLADPAQGGPFRDRFRVLRVSDGRFEESESRHGGYRVMDQGPTAILQAASGPTIMVTSRRVAPFSLQQLLSQGIDPQQFEVLVIKGVHAPVAAYRSVCRELVRVNTPGTTSADLHAFHYEHGRRPMYPWDDFVWSSDPLG